jgi:hypothetical protein
MPTNTSSNYHPIQGECITAMYEISWDRVVHKTEEELKNLVTGELIHLLIKKAKEKNLIEYTKFLDLTTDKLTIKARCYLTPDDSVRVLRLNKIIT